jgi:hypothetical protein
MSVENVSFWNTDEEENAIEETVINERLIFVPTRNSKLISELELVDRNLEYIENSRSYLIQRRKELKEEYLRYMDSEQHAEFKGYLESFHSRSISVIPKSNDIFQIELDYLLPHFTKTKNKREQFYLTLTNVFQHEIILEMSLHSGELPKFTTEQKTFVLIIQYFNGNRVADLDNRFHSFIFNALRGSQIIKDDSWKLLSYMEDGRKTTGNEYTRILVGPYEKIQEILLLSHEGE